MAPRETENNASAKFWIDQQRVLWYVMAFSVVDNMVETVCRFLANNFFYFRRRILSSDREHSHIVNLHLKFIR